jgi:hypothetical protein
MIIKKLKNKKILLKTEESDFDNGILNESIYQDDMFWQDLSIVQISGYQYIIDYNTSRIYELGIYLMENPIKFLLDTLTENKKMYLSPKTKKESASLLQDLENGY